MILTNKLNLPQALVDCCKNDPYDNGGAWRSVTQLIAPPQLVQLKIKHDHEITQDVSERLYMMYGQIVHHLLERANVEDLVEKRVFMHVGGKLVSGAFDNLRLEWSKAESLSQRTLRLSDWKFSTAWKAVDVGDEWIWQMNLLRIFLLDGFWDKECTDACGIDTDELEIVLLMRDHQKSRAKRDPNYPPLPMARIRIPLWSPNAARAFLGLRVREHLNAEKAPRPCSSKERWEKETVFAVMKVGRKTAVKLFYDDRTRADIFISEQKKPGVYYVVERPGEQVRCENYCLAAPFCRQFVELDKRKKDLDVTTPRQQINA